MDDFIKVIKDYKINPHSLDDLPPCKRAKSRHESQGMNGQQQQTDEFKDYEILLVDGFLLYCDDRVYDEFDLKILVKVDYETCKERREKRSGYLTLEGFWADPPNYFKNVVWPSFLEYHKDVDQIPGMVTINASNQSVDSIRNSVLDHIRLLELS
jgi:nicotinamide/nicotinate riboside kinase